jgi:hypothetical protein
LLAASSLCRVAFSIAPRTLPTGKSPLFQAKLEKTIGATARSGALGLLSGAEALAQALFEKKGEAKGEDEE